MKKGMAIRHLKDHQEWIPTIAEWFQSEWSDFYPEYTLDDFVERFKSRTNVDKMPLALVAMENDVAVGTISLTEFDMETRTQYFPWLASLYVRKDFRNTGVAMKLITAITEEARRLDARLLYVYTLIPKHRDFYLSIGWNFVELTEYRGRTALIMIKMLR